jgi:hypothetical protein
MQQRRTFILKIDHDEVGEQRRIEFDGDDPHLAFGIMEREGAGRSATLWEGERMLGKLKRVGQTFWELN